MGVKPCILLILGIVFFSCVAKKANQSIEKHRESISDPDVAKSALLFAKHVLKENLRERIHERASINYLDVQMIFETDDLLSYTSYFNQLYQDSSEHSNYNGFILFVAKYKNSKSAEFAFQELKSNTQIRIAEIDGFAGLLVEQVQVFERIRKSGGVFTQKDKYVFYLTETCEQPILEANWQDYENLFLEYICKKNEEIEIINADCNKDKLSIQNIKVTR